MLELDRRGIPAVGVFSDEFESAYEAWSELHGFRAARVYVEHPIQPLDDPEVERLLPELTPEEQTESWHLVTVAGDDLTDGQRTACWIEFSQGGMRVDQGTGPDVIDNRNTMMPPQRNQLT